MLRAQTLVTLKEYQSALFDVNRLMELNPSSDAYHNLQSRLKTQLVCISPILLFSKLSSCKALLLHGFILSHRLMINGKYNMITFEFKVYHVRC